MFFDSFNMKKWIPPLTKSINENKAAANTLSTQVSLQFEQVYRMQKELSLQIEELYDHITDPILDCDTEQLVNAIVSLRDELEHLRAYSLVKGDEELKHQIELLLLISDRKFFEAGISRIERIGEIYDQAMDTISDVEHTTDIENGVITHVLSGCYKYHGVIVKRANVIVNKGEGYE